MKKQIEVVTEYECCSLITDITYKHETYWFESTKRPLKMSVIMPKAFIGHKALPLIIWITGGSFMVTDRNVWMPQLIAFARAGFVVASVEYRTSNEAHFPGAVQDIKSAIRFMRAHAEEYCVAPDYVFVMGESAGGGLAAMVGASAGVSDFDTGEYLNISSVVQGVVDLHGVVDMHMSKENIASLTVLSHGINPIAPYVNGCDTYDNPVMEAATVYGYINADCPPFLIFHGTDDPIVDIAQSEKLYKLLSENDVRCDFYQVINAGHGTDDFYQPQIQTIIIDFLHSLLPA